MSKSKKITLSFKNTKRDTDLFDYIMSLDDKSFYIKEALRKSFEDDIAKFRATSYIDTVDFEALENDRRKSQEKCNFEERRKDPYNYR